MSEFVPKYRFTPAQRRYLRVKRVLDVCAAAVGLVLSVPILLPCMLWIRLESRGPAVFRQRRPGYHQKIFTIYKLRSMRLETKDAAGRVLSDAERMTRSGNFVRKTSIDELPQLVNVLRGEMSLIGPRPFLINDLGTYNDEQLIRFEVLPGITSWTALHGRNNQTIQDKYNHEIYYVKHISFPLDLKIAFKTVGLVFSKKDVEDHVTGGRVGAEIQDDLIAAADRES